MKDKHNEHHSDQKPAPLWKWLVIVLLVLAMPLFFSFYRTTQLERVIARMPANHADQPGNTAPQG